MSSESGKDSTSPRPRLGAREVEELLESVRDELPVLLGPFRTDEEEAGERVTEALLAIAGRREAGDLRARLLETVGRAVHSRWAERDPLEEEHAIH